MKHIISMFLLLAIFASIIPAYGYAANEEEVVIAYFEDGSYLTETIVEIQSRASG